MFACIFDYKRIFFRGLFFNKTILKLEKKEKKNIGHMSKINIYIFEHFYDVLFELSAAQEMYCKMTELFLSPIGILYNVLHEVYHELHGKGTAFKSEILTIKV